MEDILGNELWGQVPIGVRPQLEEAWKHHVLEQEAIQGQLKFQSEQELDEATAARTAAESQLETFQTRLAESENELMSVRQQLQNLQTQTVKVESEHSLGLEEVKSLRLIREKLEQQVKVMEEDLQKITKDADDTKSKLKEAICKSQECETSITCLRHLNTSLEQAQHVLEKRVKALIDDLDAANSSVIRGRNTSAREIATLQGENEDLSGRFEVVNAELQRVKAELSSLRTTFQSTITEKERAEASFVTMETQWEAELSAEKRLTEAYKIGEEKYKSKIKQLLDTANDIQKENSDLARQNEEAQLKLAGLQSNLKEKETEVESLKTQLAETRELVSTPTGACSFDSGACQEEARHPLVTLQERNAVDSRVAALQKDNQMLNHTVRQLTKEMEAVTENIVHHDTVYKRMMADRAKLERQLGVLNDERDRLMEERDTAARESTKLRFSAQRLEKHNDDLSRQVQVLLAQLENHRDTTARDIRCSDGLEATVADVVSSRLVTFTSIAELQEKNSQLLRAVRELESIIEERETDEKRSLELEALVSDLKREVEQLMAEKDCQAEIVSALRCGTTRNSFGRSGPATPGANKQSSGAGGGALEEQEDPSNDGRENRQAAQEIERLSKEIERIRSESATRTTGLETKIETLQSSSCTVKIELAGAKAKLESEILKTRQLEGQLKTAQVEVQSLRDRNVSLTANVASYERNVRQLEEELSERTGRLQQKESQLFEALADLKIQRENYRNLTSQSDIREASSIRQTEVILEFQEMKNKMGGMQDYLSKQLKEQIEAKDKLLNEAHKETDKFKEKLLKAEAELTDARKSSAGSGGPPANTTPTPSTSSGGLCCVSYKDQLTKYQVMTKSLEHQITTEKDNSVRLEKMVKELSACLKDSQEAKAALSEQLSGEVAEAQARATRLQAENETAEDKAAQAEQRCKDLEILHKETESTLAEVRSALEAATDRESLQRLEADMTETRTRLEAELIAHGKAVQELAAMRSRAENAEKAKDDAKQAAQATVIRLDQEISVNRDEVNRLRNENSSLTERLEVHQRRYDELLARLGPSDDRSRLAATSLGVAGTSSMATLETSELTSVVDFLRNEGKLKAAEIDKLRAENERLKTKSERTQELLRKAEADRASQETDTRVFLSTEKHAELVKKVELCQVYQDSNRLLRQELDAARASSSSGSSQLSASEADIEALKKENEILKREVKSWQQRLQKATLQAGQAVVVKEIEEKAKRAEERAVQAENEARQAKEEKTKAEEDVKKKDEIVEQLKRLGRKYKLQYTEKEKETGQKVKEIEEKQKELVTVQETIARLQSELDAERAKLETQRHEQHLRENTIRSQFEGKWRRQDEEIKALRNQLAAETGAGSSNTSAVASASGVELNLASSSGDGILTASLMPSSSASSAPAASSPPAQTSAPTLVVRPVPVQQPPTASIRPVVTAHRTTTGLAVAQPVAAAARMVEPPRAEVHPIQEEAVPASVVAPVSGLGIAPGPSTSSVGVHQAGPSQPSQGTKRPTSATTSLLGEPDDGSGAPADAKRVRTEAALVLPQASAEPTTAGPAASSFILPGGDNRGAEMDDVDDTGVTEGVMGEEEDEGDDDAARADAEDDELVLELANDDASSDATLPTSAVVVHQQPAQQMGLQVAGHGLQQRGAHAVVPQASSSIAVTGSTDDGIVPCTPTLVGSDDGGASSFVFQPAAVAAAIAFPSPPPGDQIAAVEPVGGNEGSDDIPSLDATQQDAAGLEGARNVPSISSGTASASQQSIFVAGRSGGGTGAGGVRPGGGPSGEAELEEAAPPIQVEAGVPQRIEGQPLLPVPDQPPQPQGPLGHHQQQGQRIRRIQAPAWQQQQQQLQQQPPQVMGGHPAGPGMGLRGRGARRGGRPMPNRNIWRRPQ